MKKTHEAFIEEVYNLVGNEYTVTQSYLRAMDKINFRHNVCGKLFSMSPNTFLSGARCAHCYGTPRKTTEQFINYVLGITGHDYEVLGEYKDNRTEILLKHNGCGAVFGMRPYVFNRGSRCPKCAGLKRAAKLSAKYTQSIESHRSRIFELTGSEYVLIKKVEGRRPRYLILHQKCGREYEARIDSFYRGSRCPICKESKGEEKIRRYLTENGYEFIPQYSISECKNKNPLRFDFAVCQNNKINCLIEYDGVQHFEPSSFFGGQKEHELIRKRDKIKEEYCINNGIKLIRIPYHNLGAIEETLASTI